MRDFNHTVNVLVKAFFDGTLEHGNCYACAVGNMVAEATQKKLVHKSCFAGNVIWEGCKYPAFGNSIGGWGQVVTTSCFDTEQVVELRYYKDEAKNQIDSTGYSVYEIARIEFAFEHCKHGKSIDEFNFNGLMAVVDVLADMHGISLEAKEKSKLLFVKL